MIHGAHAATPASKFVHTLKSPFKTTARMVFGGMIVDSFVLLLALLQVLVQVAEMMAIDYCLPVIPDLVSYVQLPSHSLKILGALDRCRSIDLPMYPASKHTAAAEQTAGSLS